MEHGVHHRRGFTIKEGMEGREGRGGGGVRDVPPLPPSRAPSLATVISFLFWYFAYEHEQGNNREKEQSTHPAQNALPFWETNIILGPMRIPRGSIPLPSRAPPIRAGDFRQNLPSPLACLPASVPLCPSSVPRASPGTFEDY